MIIAKKHLKGFFQEIYLLTSVAYYWLLTGTGLNALAISLLLTLAVLLWLRHRSLGIVVSAIMLLLNLVLVLALASELMEFKVFNRDALVMLVVGLTYISLNIFMSVSMLIKWASQR